MAFQHQAKRNVTAVLTTDKMAADIVASHKKEVKLDTDFSDLKLLRMKGGRVFLDILDELAELATRELSHPCLKTSDDEISSSEEEAIHAEDQTVVPVRIKRKRRRRRAKKSWKTSNAPKILIDEFRKGMEFKTARQPGIRAANHDQEYPASIELRKSKQEKVKMRENIEIKSHVPNIRKDNSQTSNQDDAHEAVQITDEIRNWLLETNLFDTMQVPV